MGSTRERAVWRSFKSPICPFRALPTRISVKQVSPGLRAWHRAHGGGAAGKSLAGMAEFPGCCVPVLLQAANPHCLQPPASTHGTLGRVSLACSHSLTFCHQNRDTCCVLLLCFTTAQLGTLLQLLDFEKQRGLNEIKIKFIK